MTGSTAPRRNLSWRLLSSPTASRMLASVLSPKPLSPRTLPSFAAFSRSSMEAMPSAFWRRTAFLGPTPSRRIISLMPGGRLASSSSRTLEPPVSRTSSMTAAIPFPTPGISWSSPLSLIFLISSVRLTILWAAVLKALLLNLSSLMVRTSPIW